MQKSLLRSLAALALFAAISPAFAESAPDAPATPEAKTESKKEIHIRRMMHSGMEMENVTFLGVETTTVSQTLIAQLNLPDHAGLVVLHVVPDSAAAGALKEHDILLKLDDQILVDEHQLAVLVRNHKEGDQVTLTYVRGGKQATASVKLTKHEAPKLSDMMYATPHGGPLMDRGHLSLAPRANTDIDRELSLIERAHRGEPVHVDIERMATGPGMRAMKLNPGNSNLVFNDDEGSLELTINNGEKRLTAKDNKGNQVFAGPVTTPEQRKAMPQNVRERLEKLEEMQNVTFQTDPDFTGAETKVFTPKPDPIRAPMFAPPASTPVRYF